ncbi:hypothetical protein Peur_026550 [Populus x canadensis]
MKIVAQDFKHQSWSVGKNALITGSGILSLKFILTFWLMYRTQNLNLKFEVEGRNEKKSRIETHIHSSDPHSHTFLRDDAIFLIELNNASGSI